MGLLDSIKNFAEQEAAGTTQGGASGGVLQAMEEHPGGLSGIMDTFRQNGMAEPVQNWASGQQTTATPEQMQQGLGGSGLIESVAQKAHISPEIAKVALAAILPMVLAHFTQGGAQVPPSTGYQSELGGMASQLLGKFL